MGTPTQLQQVNAQDTSSVDWSAWSEMDSDFVLKNGYFSAQLKHSIESFN